MFRDCDVYRAYSRQEFLEGSAYPACMFRILYTLIPASRDFALNHSTSPFRAT